LSARKKYGRRVAMTTGKRTLMQGIQSGSMNNANKTSQIVKPEIKSLWIT
jgi:hypothetical protein